jgi:hypothetical protein
MRRKDLGQRMLGVLVKCLVMALQRGLELLLQVLVLFRRELSFLAIRLGKCVRSLGVTLLSFHHRGKPLGDLGELRSELEILSAHGLRLTGTLLIRSRRVLKLLQLLEIMVVIVLGVSLRLSMINLMLLMGRVLLLLRSQLLMRTKLLVILRFGFCGVHHRGRSRVCLVHDGLTGLGSSLLFLHDQV